MFSRRLFPAVLAAGFAVLALCVGPAFSKPTAEEWKKIDAEARRAFGTTDGDARVRAAEALGAADCVEGVKLLVQLLNAPDRALLAAEAARDAYEPEFYAAVERINKLAKQNNNQVSIGEAEAFEKKAKEMADRNQKVSELSAVAYAIGDALTKTRDADAVAWLVNEGLKDKQWRARTAVALALGFAPADNPTPTPALLAALADKDGRVRGAAIEALGRRGAKDAASAILAALDDERWQVRVSAADALGVLAVRETVGPLIAHMQKEDGRLREDIDRALKAITGITFRADPLGWKGWWELNGADWDSGKLVKKEEPKEPAEGGGEAAKDAGQAGKTVTFYGIETKSKNLIFVVDVSGSMSEDAALAPDAASGRVPGQGPKGKRKIDVARYELSKAIGQLPDDARFNIIMFSVEAKVYSPAKMIVASKSTRTAAQKFAESLEPQEGTNIHDALERAFELAGGGGMQVDENYRGSVDTIFFLTDGTPTLGKITDPVKIADLVKKWNAIRKIRIHCIGIGKHAEDLLKRLSDESGGTYVKR